MSTLCRCIPVAGLLAIPLEQRRCLDNAAPTSNALDLAASGPLRALVAFLGIRGFIAPSRSKRRAGQQHQPDFAIQIGMFPLCHVYLDEKVETFQSSRKETLLTSRLRRDRISTHPSSTFKSSGRSWSRLVISFSLPTEISTPDRTSTTTWAIWYGQEQDTAGPKRRMCRG